MATDTKPTPDSKKKIASLVVIYLAALQQSPVLEDTEWAAAEELKNRIASEIPA
jgi:hypothetical protein